MRHRECFDCRTPPSRRPSPSSPGAPPPICPHLPTRTRTDAIKQCRHPGRNLSNVRPMIHTHTLTNAPEHVPERRKCFVKVLRIRGTNRFSYAPTLSSVARAIAVRVRDSPMHFQEVLQTLVPPSDSRLGHLALSSCLKLAPQLSQQRKAPSRVVFV